MTGRAMLRYRSIKTKVSSLPLLAGVSHATPNHVVGLGRLVPSAVSIAMGGLPLIEDSNILGFHLHGLRINLDVLLRSLEGFAARASNDVFQVRNVPLAATLIYSRVLNKSPLAAGSLLPPLNYSYG